MQEELITTKTGLLAAMDEAWVAFQRALDQLTEEQLTAVHDAEGWTGKDHLAHLAIWVRSVACILQGQPRHVGLGVDPALYRTHNFDAINAVIFQQQPKLPLAKVHQELQAAYQTLLDLLAAQAEADLQRPYRYYLAPDERDDGDTRSAIGLIAANTVGHFAEHLPWMEELARSA